MQSDDRTELTELEQIPNVGPAIADDLRLIGVTSPQDLLGKDPYKMHDDLCHTTGVRQDWALPGHKIMQVTHSLDDLCAGAQHQVKGIAEHNLGAGKLHLFRGHRLDGAVGPYRHERRGIDISPCKRQTATTGIAINM